MKQLLANILFIIGPCLISSLCAVNGNACNCPLQSDCYAYSNAASIFTAKLIKTERDPRSDTHIIDAYFDVEEKVKGKTENVEKVSFRAGGCSPEFRIGEYYIVFKESAEIQSLCNRTDLLSRSKNTLEYVKSLKDDAPIFTIGGIIEGLSKEQITGIRLFIEESGITKEFPLDESGMFNFVTNNHGKYKVSLVFPLLAGVEVSSDGLLLTNSVETNHEKGKTRIEYETEFRTNSCDIRRFSLSENR